jgi:hypothetical protein
MRTLVVVLLVAVALGATAFALFVTFDGRTEQYMPDEQLDCGSLWQPEQVFYRGYGLGGEDGPQPEGTAYGNGLSCDEQLEAAGSARRVALIVAGFAAGLATVVLTLPKRDPAEPTDDDPVPVEG